MDRITRVRIENVRALASVDVEISRPLTVLIGENGAGKSTILECFELLRKLAEPGFLAHFYQVHRGLPSLLRKGATSLTLGVVVEDDAGVLPTLDYQFTLAAQGSGAVFQHERLHAGPAPGANSGMVQDPILVARLSDLQARLKARPGSSTPAQRQALTEERQRLKVEFAAVKRQLDEEAPARAHAPLMVLSRSNGGTATVFDPNTKAWVPVSSDLNQPLLTTLGQPRPAAVDRLLAALAGIEVHVGFDSLASWVARTHQRPETLRIATTLFPADRLALLGINLANAWSELRTREQAHWDRTLDLVRLGLGDRVDTVMVSPDPGGGNVYLAVRFKEHPRDPILAGNLSDGQLAWLAFVALARLNPERSLLAVDEPELHLHPSLLGRVVSLLANLEGGAPVVLSTHSDRVLELLDDAAAALRVCTLEGSRTVLSRLDPAELPGWLEEYGDLGQLRASGWLSRVLVPVPGTGQ